MKSLFALLIALSLLFAGCGGGGTSSNVTLSGLVLLVGNGAAPSPAATVQAAAVTASTASDGSFTLSVPKGTSSVLVTYTPSGVTSPVIFRFDFPAVSGNTDIGDLYIGPEKINVTGKTLSTADGSPITGTTVSLAGKSATTDSSGTYVLQGVAYDSASPNGFIGLTGRAAALGFFAKTFSPDSQPVGGVAQVEDVLLQPDTGDAPPGTPFTLEGNVSPTDKAVGAIVEVYSGSTLVRKTTVPSTRRYEFWLPLGSYNVKVYAASTPGNANNYPVVIASATQSVRQNVTVP